MGIATDSVRYIAQVWASTHPVMPSDRQARAEAGTVFFVGDAAPFSHTLACRSLRSEFSRHDESCAR